MSKTFYDDYKMLREEFIDLLYISECLKKDKNISETSLDKYVCVWFLNELYQTDV